MTTGLNDAHRNRLASIVVEARRLLEADLSDRATGKYGIDPDGTLADPGRLHLDPAGLARRADLVDILGHLRSEGLSAAAAAARVVDEAAFTHLNRLIAIRIAEALDLLPPALADGRKSRGFREALDLAPLLSSDDTAGYWSFLQLCGDELAADIPGLFDPRNPLLALAPSPAVLDQIVELLSNADAASLWSAPDCLGWTYQFFNTDADRRAARYNTDGSPKPPGNSHDLAVRNQFFTPRYVVDFLLQNTLGRRLVTGDPDSPLLAHLPLLVDPPTRQGEPVDLASVDVLDPACGSGNFLVAAYDLLELAWQQRGVAPHDAAPRIVNALWGIEIDPRCTQVAAAAVVFRARRASRDLPLPRPRIICARALPASASGMDLLLAELQPPVRHLVTELSGALIDAPVLGPLLKIEECLAMELRSALYGGADGADTLAAIAREKEGDELEAQVLAALDRIADAATSTPGERLLAAEAGDAVRFVDALRHRFDVVVMNPPYGAPVDTTEEYLKRAYPRTWTEIYACFVERGLDLLKPDGALGALTSSQFFSTRRLRDFRIHLADHSSLSVLIDLGGGVLDATVNTAMFVVDRRSPRGQVRFADLTRMNQLSRAEAVTQCIGFLTVRHMKSFECIPGFPFAFHIPERILDRWSAKARLEPELADVRKGSTSFDDERFVRAHWEVGPAGLLAGWQRYQKGGEYQPYFAPSHLVLNWKHDGAELRDEGKRTGRLAQVLQSSSRWGEPGLCYPRMSSIGFAARLMPPAEIFAGLTIAILPKSAADTTVMLGLLNASQTADLLQVFGRGRATENGAIKALPFGRQLVDSLRSIQSDVEGLVEIFLAKEMADETSAMFTAPESLANMKLVREQRTRWLAEAQAMQRQVDEAVGATLGARDRLDPDLPSRVDLLTRALPDPASSDLDWASDVFSFMVGAAFGRWDLRVARNSEPSPATWNPLDRLPLAPPGMLLGDDGLPVRTTPPGYPLELPPAGMLLDQPGHRWDIEDRIGAATFAAVDDADHLLGEVLHVLGRRTIRDMLRRRFFKDHLTRYSKSRRKAPIYWPLSVPSGSWGLWVYAPALSRETLYAIAGAAADRLATAEAEILRLENERRAGGAGRSPREVATALEAEGRLAEELRGFQGEADRIANLGWEPDLDDGILLCAAPFAGICPSWNDAAVARAELRAGNHSWATVARWKGQL